MSASARQFEKRQEKRQDKRQEKRRFQRVDVTFDARYMLPSKLESSCRVIEMSPGSMALEATEKAEIGERVVVYVDKLGRFEGVVERLIPNGFALAAPTSGSRRDRLADTLTWFANRHLLTQEDESRQSERVVPFVRRTLLVVEGKETLAKIVDLSRVGVAIESAMRPAIGQALFIGRSRIEAKVVRHLANGFACAFVSPFEDTRLDESVIL